MPTNLIIARHGNTFAADEMPRRVGARTDLPLVESGRQQAARIGTYLNNNNLLPDKVYCSHLLRTKETAEIALLNAGIKRPIEPSDMFNEIDYGPDENRTEDKVIARIGKNALDKWNSTAVVPEGWKADPEKIINDWQEFAALRLKENKNKNILIVTSNGIARFSPYILGKKEFENFSARYKLKLATGAVCIFSHDGTGWQAPVWNIKP